VANGVHAAVQPMQPPSAYAIRDRVVVEAQRAELTPRYDAVLAPRERRDRAIDAAWGRFW
jgi:hypothetical protein